MLNIKVVLTQGYILFSYDKSVIISILCAVATVCMSQILKCDDGWKLHKDKCYYFSDIDDLKKTRNDSLKNCHDRSSHLVAVTDADINDFLYNNRIYDDYYWTGLRPFAQNEWGWNDGSVADDIPWGVGEPNNLRPCVRIRDSLFYDWRCINNYSTLCERDTEPEASGNWTSYAGHWYLLTDEMSQLAAVKVCLSHDGYLARLTTDEERKLDIIPSRTYVWTGLTRLVWDDGSGYNWHFWRGDHNNEHPSNTGCAALGPGSASWKINDCQDQFYFICHREPFVVAPTTSTTQFTEETSTTQYTISSEIVQSTRHLQITKSSIKTSTWTTNGTMNSESKNSQDGKVILIGSVTGGTLLIVTLIIITLVVLKRRGTCFGNPQTPSILNKGMISTPDQTYGKKDKPHSAEPDGIAEPRTCHLYQLGQGDSIQDYEDVSGFTGSPKELYYNMSKPKSKNANVYCYASPVEANKTDIPNTLCYDDDNKPNTTYDEITYDTQNTVYYNQASESACITKASEQSNYESLSRFSRTEQSQYGKLEM